MLLKRMMILCVTCALNWIAVAYRTMAIFAKKQTKQIFKSPTGFLVRSISGVLTTLVRKQDSSFQLNMMMVMISFFIVK